MSKSGHKDSHIVGGIHAVHSALKHGSEQVQHVWLDLSRKDKRINELEETARQSGIKASRVKKQQLDELLGDVRHQGVVAQVSAPASKTEKDLLEILGQLDEPVFLLVLDGVTDPHNLGACLRSADAAGVQAVIAPKDRSAGLTPVACKVASGAAETVPYVQVTNLVRTLEKLQKDHAVWLTGTAGEADSDIYHADLKGNIAIVMGAEGKGMRRLTRETCDSLIKLPMKGSVESLNVSVATGICLYEAVRQRGG